MNYISNKVDQSLKLIENLYSNNQKNILAFSGGKDSIVLYHLAKRTNLPFEIIYANTTIDPPGHISFIRHNFKDVIISHPKLSFYEIIAKYGLPTRFRRFCCQHLKEYVGKGCKVFEGVRMDEGHSRKKRLSALIEPEICDSRIKGKIHAYPLLNWSSVDIWTYISKFNLPVPEIYSKGFTRLGCIGCPLAYKNTRIAEFKMFPRYVSAILKAIRFNIDNKGTLSKFFYDEYDAFYWWISVTSIKSHKQETLFRINCQESIKSIFKL